LNIAVIGLNHKTASVEMREKLASFLNREGAASSSLKAIDRIEESVVLTTCNRVEVLFTSENLEHSIREVLRYWKGSVLPSSTFSMEAIYVYRNEEAVRHLFRVASSLDSMVIGEPQILGQLKEAYREAVAQETTGVVLNRLLHKTFSVAKRIRTETGIASHAVSISFAAVELAKKIFQDLSGKKALLIGAGEMAELAAEHLLRNRVQRIIVANRTLTRAMELSKRWPGQAVSLEEIPAALIETDIVISSTGASETIIHYPQVKAIMKQRKQRPLFFIDIAVPRDIDPKINRLDNVFLYDIDDLQGIVTHNIAERKQEGVRAERIVQEECIKFSSWLSGLEVVPTIVTLRKKMDDIMEAEWKRAESSLQGLTDEQRRAVERLTISIMNKVLHDPITFLKESANGEHQESKIDRIQKVFNLTKNESE
jgi:glutamyl-tRNA reductase